jgi:hypothetical protein
MKGPQDSTGDSPPDSSPDSSDAPADAPRLEELWARWVSDRSLTKKEEDELAEAAARDASFRAVILADERLEGALAALGRRGQDAEAFARQFAKRVGAERDGASFVSSVERRMRAEVVAGALARERPSRRLPWLALPAVMAAAAVALVWWRGQPAAPVPVSLEEPAAPPRPPTRSVRLDPSLTVPAAERPAQPAQLSIAAGTVYLLADGRRVTAAAGAALPAGTGLVTVGNASRAVVAFGDRTRLSLDGETVLAQLAQVVDVGTTGVPAKAAFVARGRLHAEVPAEPGARPLIITTPQAEVTSTGGKLSLAVDAASTRLDVHEGRAELARIGGGPPTVVGAAQFALVGDRGEPPTAMPRGGLALFVTEGSLVLTVSDSLVKKRLESLGFEVYTQRAGPPRAEDLRRARLIVISSTASARAMSAHYRDLSTPIIVWEPYSFDDLGMTGALAKVDIGSDDTGGEALIKDPGHPLAAGRSGTTTLVENPAGLRPRLRRLSFGSPGPHAQVIAVWPNNPSRAMVFAYERGAPMPGLPAAPGRRVGLFMHNFTAKVMTETAWAMFDAAVKWCLRDDPGPRP